MADKKVSRLSAKFHVASVNFIAKTIYPLWKVSDRFFIYRAYSWLLRKIAKVSSYSVLNFEEYGKSYSLDKTILASNRTGYTSNRVINDSDEKQYLFTVPLKDVNLYKMNNVFICGDSDLIYTGDLRYVVNDFCYNKEERVSYADSSFLRQKGNMILLRRNDFDRARKVESGIMMCGQYSNNYYHNLFDNLIRLLALDKVAIDSNAVILADKKIQQVTSFKSIFDILTGTYGREVVFVNPREVVKVNNLFYISHINKILPSIKDISKYKIDDFVYDWAYMEKLRDKLLIYKSNEQTPSRIFITRKSVNRRHVNENDIMDYLKPMGFVSIAPEEYDFSYQMALFNNAEYIVGCSGAAMTNLLFCSPFANILVIRATKNNDMVYSTISHAMGCNARTYCAMMPVKHSMVQHNYSVDMDMFKRTFEALESNRNSIIVENHI